MDLRVKNNRLIMFLKARVKDLFIIVSVLLVIELWSSRHMRSVPKVAQGSNFSVESLQPKNESLSLWQKGSYTLIYAFAPWCKVCSASASNINRIANPQKGIHTLALALSWSSREAVLDFVEQARLEAPVLLGEQELANILNVESFPSYLIVGPNGDIIWAWSGYTTEPGIWLRLQVSKLLG